MEINHKETKTKAINQIQITTEHLTRKMVKYQVENL